jgi:hypothetical protein
MFDKRVAGAYVACLVVQYLLVGQGAANAGQRGRADGHKRVGTDDGSDAIAEPFLSLLSAGDL